MKLQISLFALVVGATAQSTIINDLTQKISPQVTTLKSDVDAVPQSGLTGGLVSSSWTLPVLFQVNPSKQQSI